MAWVRLDDGFADHPKVAAVGPLGMALQVAALCYCNKYTTDGFVPHAIAVRLVYFEGLAEPEDVIERLIDCGMWEEVGGGYQIHDYHDYQPSKAQVEELREKRREAGRKGGQANGKQSAKQNDSKMLNKTSSTILAQFNPDPVPVPIPNKEDEDDDAHARAWDDDPEWHDLVLAVAGATFDATTAQAIAQDCNDIGVDAVKEAMRRSIEFATGNRLAYYRTIVNGWRGKVRSLDDIRILDEAVKPPTRDPPRHRPRESAAERLLREEGLLQ